MDRFLEQSQQVGQQDSEGRFELAGDRALSKLAQHTVAKPEQWILKMVQAAVAGGAQRLDITQSRRDTRLVFVLSKPPSPMDLEKALLEVHAPATPMLRELSIGLRSLLSTRQMTVYWPDGDSLHWNGEALTPGRQPGHGAGLEILVTNPSAGWLSGHKVRAAESRILQTDAAYCPIPLWLDRREVGVFDLVPKFRPHLKMPRPRHFAAGYLCDPPGTAQTAIGSRLKNPAEGKAPLVYWPRSPDSLQMSFSLFSSNIGGQETFRIIWTRLGVACAVREIPAAPLGGFLQLPGDHLRTDLSGLALEIEYHDVGQALGKLALLSEPGQFVTDWWAAYQPLKTVDEMIITTAIFTGKAVGLMMLLGLCIPAMSDLTRGADLRALFTRPPYCSAIDSENLRDQLLGLLKLADAEESVSQILQSQKTS